MKFKKQRIRMKRFSSGGFMTGTVVVIGNEKGGTGKSTLAMHLIASFLKEGKKVSSIDLDGRQGTLTHYIQNRAAYAERTGMALDLPQHMSVTVRENPDAAERQEDEKAFAGQLAALSAESDVVVIDTPGADNYLFRLAHVYADILITPLNDSLIDLDVLAKIDPETLTVKTPGHYAQTVWQARQKRAALRKKASSWFILRNRLMHVSTKNEKTMRRLLDSLGERIRFTPLGGLGERIIFRELFLKGLTLLDVDDKRSEIEMSVSHIAARQELRTIRAALPLNGG